MNSKTKTVFEIDNLIALWTFQERPGEPRKAIGKGSFPLSEMAGDVERVDDGIFGPYAARLAYQQWFKLDRGSLSALNIHGKDAQVTVVAWIKRQKKPDGFCEAVAGLWDEQRSKRQYALFVAMPVDNAEGRREQVGGHISSIGGSSPGHDHSRSRANGATPVPFDEWVSIGFTYDGDFIRAYYNGAFDALKGVNPYQYPNGIFDGGPDGSAFTVGSVPRERPPQGPGNYFTGVIGGIAVFDRALHTEEMHMLSDLTP